MKSQEIAELAKTKNGIVVRGSYGSGKVEYCVRACELLDKKSHVCHLDLFDPSELMDYLDKIPAGDGVIFSGLDEVQRFQDLHMLRIEIIKSVRLRGHQVFMTLSPEYARETIAAPVVIIEAIVHITEEDQRQALVAWAKEEQ